MPVLQLLPLSLSLSLSLPARRFASTHYVNFNFPHKNKLFLLDVGNTFQHMQRVWHAHHASLHVCVCVCESTCHAGIVSVAFEFPQLSAFPCRLSSYCRNYPGFNAMQHIDFCCQCLLLLVYPTLCPRRLRERKRETEIKRQHAKERTSCK